MLRALCWLLLTFTACSDDDPAKPWSPAPRPDAGMGGAGLYATRCALCHGDKGQGYAADAANALGNKTFLASASDEFLARSIERGRPGTSMSAWGQSRGGPLDDAQLALLVEHLRSLSSEPAAALSADPVSGAAQRAQSYYQVKCKMCHGDKGTGGMYMSIANPEFLSQASDAFLRYAIREGRPGTPMLAFAGQLPDATIDDLVALIRSWQAQPADAMVVAPEWPSGGPISNPDGAEPEFAAGRYVKVEALHAALQAGKRLLIADARTPNDYVTKHIQGAVSVPFYEPEKYLDRLPKDVTIVTYCGCPHAASGALADSLKERGYTRVWVLDEGYFVWRDSGYPVMEGSAP
jgi:cytochrome c oxidase cbb3-type subunit 3/ubiquinol-cytochrome c reductase cytochrome c subunit